jgi:hypothetical protein
MPLRAPTEDEGMRSLLDGLNASEAPAPVNAPTTDGDLSARYAAGPGAPPARHPTPTPEPSVVFSQTMRLAAMPAPEAAIRERAATEAARLATTVRIDRQEAERALSEAGVLDGRDDVREEAFRSGERRGLLLGFPIGFAAGGAVAFLVAFFLTFARGAHTSSPPASAPSLPAASAPPVPAAETSAPTPAPAEAPAPADSRPAPDAVPASASAASPGSAGSAGSAAPVAEPRPPPAHPAAGKRPARGAPAASSAPAGQPATKARTDKNTMVNEL